MSKAKLSGPEKLWKRCGNTPYYYHEEGPFPGAYYTNPFTWTQISVAGISTEGVDEGSFSVVFRRAPRYDWDAMKAGIHSVTSDKKEQQDILRATHEWATHLMYAKEADLPIKKLRMIFEAAPDLAQDLALEGVGALLHGDMEAEIRRRIQEIGEVQDEKTLLVVLENSPAHENLNEVKGFYTDLERTMIVQSPEEGLDKVLEFFGIYEC